MVDEDWLYNQWREYNYSAPFPDLNDKDLGDFVGGDLSKKLRDEFIILFVGVSELKKARYISWSWIRIRTEEEDNQKLIESMRRVLKELLRESTHKLCLDIVIQVKKEFFNHHFFLVQAEINEFLEKHV